MEYVSAVGSVALLWFLVVVLPGPNFIVVTRNSMTQSRKTGIFIALGASIGAGTWASASLLGLSALLAWAGWLYDVIRTVGGCYLAWMGMRTLWHAVTQPVSFSPHANDPDNNRAAFHKGLFTSFSNPKTAAFFGSLFVSTFPAQAPLWVYVVAVFLVIVISMSWYSAMACFFSFPRIQTLYKKAKRPLDMLTGSLLTFMGGRLLWKET